MRIQSLNNRYPGGSVYVVGTGASLRCFPLDYLADKTTIGLNQAYKHLATTFNLTVHPELVDEYIALGRRPPARWLVKKKPPWREITLDDADYYVFHTSPDLATVSERPADVLYIGSGVQCTALDLAARMGARDIFMIGCDMGALGGDHHGHAQHVRWLGLPPEQVYQEYRKTTARVRKVLRERFGVRVFTLTPFVSVAHPEEDYARLCLERGLPALPRPTDVSPYKRTS